MNGKRLVVLVVSAATVLVASETALAQGGLPVNNDISITVSGGGARCSLVELKLTSGMATGGHESTTVHATGARIVRGWFERSGYTVQPWNFGRSATVPDEWHNTYNGPPHFIFRLTGTTQAVFWAEFQGGSHQGPYETSPVYVSITGASAGPRIDVSSLKSAIDADGVSSTPIYMSAVDANCPSVVLMVTLLPATAAPRSSRSTAVTSPGV